jgi:hypothetical protein
MKLKNYACSQINSKCTKKWVHFLAQNVSPYCAFTHLSHIQFNYSFNKETNKCEYYKSLHEDKNVIPYHSTLLLSWGTHFNILHITYSYWSFYLPNYAMKCEPHGTLNLNTKNGKKLGL